MMTILSVRNTLSLALIASCATHGLAQAQSFLDFAKSKTENREFFLVYDMAGFSGNPTDLKERVREALTYQGDNAYVKESLQIEAVPQFPGKLTIKSLGMNLPISINIPSCPGAAFTVSSSDQSLSKWGDSAQYMACGFRYSGGYRVNFYSSYHSSSGGINGLLSGKTLVKLVSDAVGFNGNPQRFIESSISKLEELFTKSGWTYSIVEMSPVLEGRTVVEDPFATRQAVEGKRSGDRTRRLAARAELSKLGVDASDRTRFIRAIETGDEDVMDLFVEAGALDLNSKDATGKTPADYATNSVIRARLVSVR